MNIRNIIIIFISGLLFFSCADPDLSPIITFDKAGKGGYPRLLERQGSEFDLNNLSGSQMSYSVEFVTIDQGKNVTNYTVNVAYTDNNSDNGDDSKTAQVYKSFGQGDFADSPDGFKSISLTIPILDLTNLLGVSTDNMKSGDAFNFSTSVTLEDGQVFTFDNSSAAVNGSAFQGFFAWDIKVTCPLPDSRFVGTYKVEYVGDVTAPLGLKTFGEDPGNTELTVVSGTTTKRKFTLPYLPDFSASSSITLEIDFVCDVAVVSSSQAAGVTCSNGIFFDQGDDPAPFDFDSDAEFTLNLIEDSKADCGAPGSYPVSIKFTKQ